MAQDIQLEVVRKITASHWCQPSKPGDVVWVTQEGARHLINEGLCRYVAGIEKPTIGPQETPEAGPSEVKKNLSDSTTDGPSTDSAGSSAPGKARLSSASAAALVSPERR